ncbi:MAG: hypothetical protein ACK5HU_00055 [Flavobacteriales bacterium]
MKYALLLNAILVSTFIFSQSRYSQGNKSYKNDQLKELKITQNGIDKTLKFDYNSNGLRISSKIFDSSGAKLFEATKSYTNSKDLSQIWYDNAGGVSDKLVYKYDSNNRLNRIYNYFGDSNNYFMTNYDYNGNKIISATSYFMIDGNKYDLSQIDSIISQF